MIKRPQVRFEFITFLLAIAWILIGASVEFYHIAWGTGVWLGQFALTWLLAFLLFSLFCVFGFFCVVVLLWQPQKLERISRMLEMFRTRLGFLRWFITAVLLLSPVFILQYTFWGVVLHGPYLRIMFVVWVSILMGWLLTKTGFIDWSPLLVSLILMTSTLSLFAPLVRVTSYPFSLGWSEGNRLWDYSVLFGREIYVYPADKVIPVFLETSRQFVGGIPFLIPGLKIEQARLWLALVDVIPYLILGWIAFRLPRKDLLPWFLAGVWAFTFVRQGPIHAPLLICAIVVALAWGRPLWLAIPLIFAAGYFAEASRYTWLFAPAMWSVMLEFASAYELNKDAWWRAFSVGIAGVLGGYVAPFYLPVFVAWIKTLGQANNAGGTGTGGIPIGGDGGVSLSAVESGLSSQPLLWNRLLPNATYGPGILFGLILAVVPLILVLTYLMKSKQWQLNSWQKAAIILPLLAFLIVGLIVSVKIGGGGDLHNLDMFIIGLLFAGAIAWRSGGYEWIRNAHVMPKWVASTIIALLVLPALRPLTEMRPLSITNDPKFVATLADITQDPLPNPLPDTLPSNEDTQRALEKLQKAVISAMPSGQILFMDQRQLLTFGYIEGVPLVPEYDKKLLIDMAMGDNAAYFESFYNDLESHRFSLIITSPVNRRLDQEEGHFGEENNAWVKWVTKPLLCYYEPLDILKRVDVELLVPRTGVLNCESELP